MDISLLRIALYTSFFGAALVLFFIALILLPWIIEYSKISINWRRYFKVDKVTKSNFTPIELKEIELDNNYGKSSKFYHVFSLKKIHEREKSTSYDGKSLSGLKLGPAKAAATSRTINSEYKLVAKGRGDVAISNRQIYITSKDNRNIKRRFDLKLVDEIALYESDRVVFISSSTQGVFPLKLTFLNYKDAAHFINIFWTVYSENFDSKTKKKKSKPLIIDGPIDDPSIINEDDNGVLINTEASRTLNDYDQLALDFKVINKSELLELPKEEDLIFYLSKYNKQYKINHKEIEMAIELHGNDRNYFINEILQKINIEKDVLKKLSFEELIEFDNKQNQLLDIISKNKARLDEVNMSDVKGDK